MNKNVQRIASLDDLAAGLDALCRIDPRLEMVRGKAGEVPDGGVAQPAPAGPPR